MIEFWAISGSNACSYWFFEYIIKPSALTMNSLLFLNPLRIHYIPRWITLNSLSVLKITIFSRIHYEFTISFEICCEFSIFFANLLWIHNQLREFTMDPLHFWRITYKCDVNNFNVFWIHFLLIYYEYTITRILTLLRGFTINSLSVARMRFREFVMIWLSNTRIHYEFSISSANSLHMWIYYPFYGNSYKFIIIFMNSLWF